MPSLAGRAAAATPRAGPRRRRKKSAASGSSVATIRKIETGAVAEPGYFTILAITRAIGASIADIAELARRANSCQNASTWVFTPARSPCRFPAREGDAWMGSGARTCRRHSRCQLGIDHARQHVPEPHWSPGFRRCATRAVIPASPVRRIHGRSHGLDPAVPAQAGQLRRRSGHAVVPAQERPAAAQRTIPGPPPAVRALVRPGPRRPRPVTAGWPPVRPGRPPPLPRRPAACAPGRVPMPRTRTGRQDTIVAITHGARAIPAWAIRWEATCPAIPSANEQIADHLANRRVPALTSRSCASQARSAYAA